ncbi:LCP family protein required for cell wall assembly [Salirhabdus euzebyi]|uniref:LCP family protein required for cell wall assembly n=1 Tax=Salirhabdus euzebyi TaxID=394506 RepID=A0A841Q5H3_9BACI|nr:LCP family protein [Salirhabdus euzebyi]MBB6453719.1 LCP family protein required for cell wall assembly [Salirhabdus euzebyi]
MENNKEKKVSSRRKKLFKISLAVSSILIIGAGIFAYSVYSNVKNTVNDRMYTPVKSIDRTPEQKEKAERKEPLNILLMGVDEREYDRGRSDTLMVLSVNPNTDSMQIISIPRDSRTEIVGRGFDDKINHAYAFGGTDMAIATVENFANIELDYYVKMNMEGLTDLVDAVGGITVNNDIDWMDDSRDFHYKKGELELDGELAMGYVRMRYQDPNGDFGRNQRQRQVIEGIIDKGANIGSITKIDDVLAVLGDNMQTNMNFEDMKNIFKNYRDARKNTSNYQVTGNGTYIGDIYYLIVSEEERKKVHEMIVEFNEEV